MNNNIQAKTHILLLIKGNSRLDEMHFLLRDVSLWKALGVFMPMRGLSIFSIDHLPQPCGLLL